MAMKVFLPQDLVDSWVTSDRVELRGEVLTFRSNGLTLRLVPAYYFDHVSAGTDDGHDLLGKAKTKTAIAALGAEIYMNSVLVDETAYDVEAGFVAKPVDPTGTHPALGEALEAAGY